MSNIRDAKARLIARILDGDGRAPAEQRRAAFGNRELSEPLGALVRKVAEQAQAVRDEDLSAARAAGFSEDQLFEIVVCAAVGQAARQHDAALAALQAATAKD